LRHDGPLAVAGALGIVEVAGRVGLQAHCELVKALRHLMVAVKAAVERGLAALGQPPQHDDLVTAADVDIAVHHFQAERLVQAAGDPPPGERRAGAVQSTDPPHVAVPGADGQVAAGQEVEAGEPQLGGPRVFVRCSERVGGERAGVRSVFQFGGERLGPTRFGIDGVVQIAV
jgi:hypothetical protein